MKIESKYACLFCATLLCIMFMKNRYITRQLNTTLFQKQQNLCSYMFRFRHSRAVTGLLVSINPYAAKVENMVSS